MLRKALCLIVASILVTLLIPSMASEETEQYWWQNWVRDRNHNKIDDVLEFYLSNPDEFAENGRIKVIIDYARAPTESDVKSLEYLGSEITYISSYIDAIIASVPLEKVEGLTQLKDVVMIEANTKLEITLDTSVPSIGVDDVWRDYGVYGEGITIAIIDTGIDANHTALNDLDDDNTTFDPKVIAFYDVVNSPDDVNGTTEPYDDNGHGSYCAGIAAGTGGGEGKYIGVAPKANLVGVKVMDENGDSSAELLIHGVEWCIENKDKFSIDVLSISASATFPIIAGNDGNSAMSRACDNAVENGLVVTVSAGNRGPQPKSIAPPGDAKKVITVGNVNDDHDLYYSSSRGPCDWYPDTYVKPDVCAVGVDVYSVEANTADGYISGTGTSASCPHVAGLTALMLQTNPNLLPDEIKEILCQTAGHEELPPLYSGTPNNAYGWGVVDAVKAMKEIVNTTEGKPICTIIEPLEGAVVKGKIKISGTASVQGGEIKGVEVSIDDSSFSSAMRATGKENWEFLWDTTVVSNGLHTIYARAFTDDAYSSIASRRITVNNTEEGEELPVVHISMPGFGATVKGVVKIRGTAVGNIQKVEVKVDNGSWEPANTTNNWINWVYTLDTTTLANGEHTIYARAWDGEQYSEVKYINITVDNRKSKENGILSLPAFFYIIIIVLMAVMLRKR